MDADAGIAMCNSIARICDKWTARQSEFLASLGMDWSAARALDESGRAELQAKWEVWAQRYPENSAVKS